MVRQQVENNPAWRCPHCNHNQLWSGNSDQALVSCSNCRGISFLDTRKDKPEVEMKDGFKVRRDFPSAITEVIMIEEETSKRGTFRGSFE